jgi:hypothetical protein
VGVDVRYGLASPRAGVEHDPVTLVADPLGHRHLMSLGDDLVQQSGVGGRERGDGTEQAFRHTKILGGWRIRAASGDSMVTGEHSYGLLTKPG